MQDPHVELSTARHLAKYDFNSSKGFFCEKYEQKTASDDDFVICSDTRSGKSYRSRARQFVVSVPTER